MGNLKEWVSNHRGASLLAVAALVVFVGLSVVSAMSVAERRAAAEAGQTSEEEQAQGASSSEPAAEEGDASAGASENDPAAGGDEDGEGSGGTAETASLTAEQQAAIDLYDDETKEFVQTLCASVWSANNGLNTVTFDETSYKETSSGEVEEHTYAITHLEKSYDQAGGEVYYTVFLTDTGTHIVSYYNATGQVGDVEAEETSSTLSSSTMFALGDTEYSGKTAVKTVTVKGLNSDVTELFGGDVSGLTSALSSWCAAMYPTVTEAVWGEFVYIDYGENTVSTQFTLNGETSFTVDVVYDAAENSYEISN